MIKPGSQSIDLGTAAFRMYSVAAGASKQVSVVFSAVLVTVICAKFKRQTMTKL